MHIAPMFRDVFLLMFHRYPACKEQHTYKDTDHQYHTIFIYRAIYDTILYIYIYLFI